MLLLLLLGWHCWTGRSIYDRWDHVDLAQKHHSNSSSSTQFQVPEWAQAGVTSPVAFDDVSFWSRNPPPALPAPSWAAVVAVPIHFGWPFGFTPRCVRQRTANSHAKWHLCHALHIPRHMIWLGTGRDIRTDRQTHIQRYRPFVPRLHGNMYVVCGTKTALFIIVDLCFICWQFIWLINCFGPFSTSAACFFALILLFAVRKLAWAERTVREIVEHLCVYKIYEILVWSFIWLCEFRWKYSGLTELKKTLLHIFMVYHLRLNITYYCIYYCL